MASAARHSACHSGARAKHFPAQHSRRSLPLHYPRTPPGTLWCWPNTFARALLFHPPHSPTAVTPKWPSESPVRQPSATGRYKRSLATLPTASQLCSAVVDTLRTRHTALQTVHSPGSKPRHETPSHPQEPATRDRQQHAWRAAQLRHSPASKAWARSEATSRIAGSRCMSMAG
ncbi:hypothetical protein TRVL_07004 [Trypanosoma vivax]|nr:hypothetical protein TRVL_07004 [Trypanosoma vivax]